MKKIFTLILSTMSFTMLNSQTFSVEYNSKQKTSFADSVKNQAVSGKIFYKDSNDVQQTLSSPIFIQLPDFEVEMTFTIQASKNGSKMYFGNSSSMQKNIGVNVITPDTIYYSNGQWSRIVDGQLEAVETVEIAVTETKETKNILGYICSKYISSDGTITFWASKGLPNTLLPYTGLKWFKCGILEISNPSLNFHTQATAIKKVN